MKSVHVSMPQAMHAFIQNQVGDHSSYSTPSEYVRDLIRQDQRQKIASRINELVREALESGPAKPIGPNWKRDLMRKMQQRAKKLPRTNGRTKTKNGR